MNRWTYVLLLIWTTNLSTIRGSEFNPEFKAIPLGSTSFLITWKWDSNQSSGTLYEISYQPVYGTDLGPEVRAPRLANAADTQTKLNNLRENTKYRIKMTNSLNYRNYFMFEARTGPVDFSVPFKPDFKYSFSDTKIFGPRIRITWLPCGKEGDCGDERAGSSFYVKYRRHGESTFHQEKEYYEDYIYIDCVPGEKYEIAVGTMDPPFETESDVQEIVVPSSKSQSQ